MSNIKVSVIIPVYNVEKYLKKCLDSVINQTLKDIEIICVNDASTDKSLEILEQYAKKDNRITIINNKKNSGGGFSRNEALKVAKGEYVSFIDSDDWVDEKMLEYTYNESKLNNLDLIIFLAINYDDSTKEFYETDYYNFKCLKEPYRNKIVDFNEVKDFIFCFAVSPVLKLYKKELLDKCNAKFPEERVMHDNPFFYHVFLNVKKIKLAEEYFYYRRRHESSLINLRGEHTQDIIPITDHIINSFKDNNAFDYYKRKLFNRKITIIRTRYKEMSEEFQKNFFEYISDEFNSIYNNSFLWHEYILSMNKKNLSFFWNNLKSKSYSDFNMLNDFSEAIVMVNDLEKRIECLENENEILINNNNKMKYSKSWKITNPLRKITNIFRNLLKN